MNRRDFLRKVGLSAGGVALLGAGILVPERTFFLPPRGGWIALDPQVWQGWRWDSETRERFVRLCEQITVRTFDTAGGEFWRKLERYG